MVHEQSVSAVLVTMRTALARRTALAKRTAEILCSEMKIKVVSYNSGRPQTKRTRKCFQSRFLSLVSANSEMKCFRCLVKRN